MAQSDHLFQTLQPSADASRTLVLCDLDGTLVLDNSFHIFMAMFWSAGSLSQRLTLLASIGPRLIGRMTGGHAGLKKRVLLAFARQPSVWQQQVINLTLTRLRRTRSEPVANLLSQWHSRGARIVLATAAPELYARPFAQEHGATCLATPGRVGPGWHELLSERKAAACRTLIRAQPDPWIVVITDHVDDFPLLQLANRSVVQAPPGPFARIRAALAEKPGTAQPVQIDPTITQEGGGYWLWLDDRPHGPLDGWEVKTVLSKHRHALLYVGNGNWARTGPGKFVAHAALRRDCPLPPSSRQRLATFLRRRVQRDWLGIFH